MRSLIQSVLTFCFIIKYSYTLDCSSQTVNFTATETSFEIVSDPNDLTAKNCKYTFIVPKYFVPSVLFLNVHLTGNNKITTKQYSEYGGAKNYDVSVLPIFLAPTDFSIEINLPAKTANDSFSILISVRDNTPAITGDTFLVRKDLGTLIDSLDIKGNSTLLQNFDAQNPQVEKYYIRVALFSSLDVSKSTIDRIYIYDDGAYRGSLLDVANAPNASRLCEAKQFAIVNTNEVTGGIYTVLITEAHEWDENAVSATTAPDANTTQTFTATNGLVVYHEISNPIGGSLVPNYYQQITFRGDGELNVYAGCVLGSDETRRIATITRSNAHNYENLLIYGRCKTFVLTKGVFQWQSIRQFPTTTFRHEIGRQGVIMSSSYPYPNVDNSTRNYLIQSPDADSKENIIVTYEIANMAPDVYFFIDQEIKAYQDSNKTLKSNDSTFTSVSTYQQYILYRAPTSSDGFLIRYTVTSSASFTTFGALIFIFFVKFLVGSV